jgi:hypothetical protein
MQHNLLILIVELGSRVTPTEIRIEVIEPDRDFRRDYDRVKPCRICKQQANLPLVSKGLNTIYLTRADTTSLILPFRQYSITVEKSACSTPCAAIRADRLVPIRTNVAIIGISLFTALISFSEHIIYGKACAKRVHVWKRVNKWRESRKLLSVTALVMEVMTTRGCRSVGMRRNDDSKNCFKA